ncbi:putative [histone H3]-dimethyl-L-lysine(36) demethylase [Helianthus anomalus]
MVYISILFSWFAWHVEDHDLHSLNYMHMGAGKTWYGVPKDVAVAFEDVIQMVGYGGEINPIGVELSTFKFEFGIPCFFCNCMLCFGLNDLLYMF